MPVVSLYTLLMAFAGVCAVAGYDCSHGDPTTRPAWANLFRFGPWPSTDQSSSTIDSPRLVDRAFPAVEEHGRAERGQAASDRSTQRDTHVAPATHLPPGGPPTRVVANQAVRKLPAAWFTRPPTDPFLVPRVGPVVMVTEQPIVRCLSAPVRDLRGQLWLAVQSEDELSTRLVSFDPLTGRCTPQGDLKTAWHQVEQSASPFALTGTVRLATPLVVAANGDIVFATTHELPAGAVTSLIWRVAAKDSVWALAGTFDQEVTDLAAGSSSFYAWSPAPPRLWQTTNEGQSWSRWESASQIDRFAPRLLADGNDHVYLIEYPDSDGDDEEEHPRLVQLDADLREIANDELPAHVAVTDRSLAGFLAHTLLADGSLVWVNDVGFLVRAIRNDRDSAARVEPLGWFHPLGAARVDLLATYEGNRYLCGIGQSVVDEPTVPQWLVFDLTTGESRAQPLSMSRFAGKSALQARGLARDDRGNFYATRFVDVEPARIDPHLRRVLLAVGGSSELIATVEKKSIATVPSAGPLLRFDIGVELDRE